MSDVPQNLKWN